MGITTHAVAIIGSGPAAYTAAIYTARADLRPIVFEGSGGAGGALMTTTEVENFPGFSAGILGPDLIGAMRLQAQKFGAGLLQTTVASVQLGEDEKIIVTEDGETLRASAIIVATGSKYRTLGLANEDRLTGRGVSWCATCDGPFFRDQDIAVVGGGDSALEEANYLSRFARTVTILHRRDTLRASQIMQARALANSKVSFRWNTEVVAVEGDAKLASIRVRDVTTGRVSDFALNGLFIAIGHEPRSDLFRGQLDLDEHGYIRVSAPSSRTNISGVFACGDVVDRHYRQAFTAAGTGCVAALDAERFLIAQRARGRAPMQSSQPVQSTQRAREPIVVLHGNTKGATVETEVLVKKQGSAVHLTDQTFSKIVLESERPVLVDFWATWCGPCRLMSPAIDDIAREYVDRLVVVKLDVDECAKTAAMYDVTSMPVIKIFVGGEVVHTIVGAKPKGLLVEALKEFLRK